MYQVKILMGWHEEAKARLWCAKNSLLFRLADSRMSYEETRKNDNANRELLYLSVANRELLYLSGKKYIVSAAAINRIFCFKYEEDAVHFKLRWV